MKRKQDVARYMTQRLARQVVFRGRRLVGHWSPGEGDMIDRTWHPDHMPKARVFALWDYAIATPNRWQIDVEVHCKDGFGNYYTRGVQVETVQSAHYAGFLDYRDELFRELLAEVNPNHVWAYSTEIRII